MKFDLTFLRNLNEKSSFEKSPKCFMAKSYPCSVESDPVSHSDETDGGNDHSIWAASIGTTRSASIPLPSSHVPRTQSEVQLTIDEEAAEQRDARMFDRLVNGIRERQQQSYLANPAHLENSLEQRISRLVQARLAPLGEVSHLQDDSNNEDLPPNEIFTQNQDNSDAWSISGYEHDEQAPPLPIHVARQEVTGDEHCDKDEGLFEMDL